MTNATQGRYWHFAKCDDDGTARLNYGDGREIRAGETLTVDGEPVLCEHGLHASQRALDALGYCSYDACLCLVQLGGTVIDGDDKSVATERTVVTMLSEEQTDALLREFARHCVLSVAHLWEMPDVVRQYLETGDNSLRSAAWDAAGAAAGAAAWGAAWDAAGAAAGAAAWGAAWDAARAAAGAAAWGAAWDAAWGAAWAAQNEWLERRAMEMMEARNDSES